MAINALARVALSRGSVSGAALDTMEEISVNSALADYARDLRTAVSSIMGFRGFYFDHDPPSPKAVASLEAMRAAFPASEERAVEMFAEILNLPPSSREGGSAALDHEVCAIALLGAVGGERAVEHLLRALENPRLAGHVARALGTCGNPVALRPLVMKLTFFMTYGIYYSAKMNELYKAIGKILSRTIHQLDREDIDTVLSLPDVFERPGEWDSAYKLDFVDFKQQAKSRLNYDEGVKPAADRLGGDTSDVG
jgi:hypothetical protein